MAKSEKKSDKKDKKAKEPKEVKTISAAKEVPAKPSKSVVNGKTKPAKPVKKQESSSDESSEDEKPIERASQVANKKSKSKEDSSSEESSEESSSEDQKPKTSVKNVKSKSDSSSSSSLETSDEESDGGSDSSSEDGKPNGKSDEKVNPKVRTHPFTNKRLDKLSLQTARNGKAVPKTKPHKEASEESSEVYLFRIALMISKNNPWPQESSGEENEDEKPKAAQVKDVSTSEKAGKDQSSSSSGDSSDESSNEEEVKAAPAPSKTKESDSSSEEESNDSDSDEDEDAEMENTTAAKKETSQKKEDLSKAGKRKTDEATTAPAKKVKLADGDATKPSSDSSDDSKVVFVGQLSWNVDNDWLAQEFADCGEVVSARVQMDRNTSKSRGFGFVDFATVEGANAAIALNGIKEIDGRTVKLDKSSTRSRDPEKRAKAFGDVPSEPSTVLFVGNVSFNTTEDGLWEIFSEYGEVKSVRLPTDRDSQRPKGFGYVEFVDIESSKKAFEGAWAEGSEEDEAGVEEVVIVDGVVVEEETEEDEEVPEEALGVGEAAEEDAEQLQPVEEHVQEGPSSSRAKSSGSNILCSSDDSFARVRLCDL
ncbi:RNA-binding domain-containing protein [Sanghuangporus baumii]|uniref:RNA-binding domain-containing protein n=1 Tax=Sanghuangporus baumii TaxID=108892 RepID=A0A9Q5HYG2_SANBA|nr:RNA-binding domain-containing protein [Sanghuangporus baumii]